MQLSHWFILAPTPSCPQGLSRLHHHFLIKYFHGVGGSRLSCASNNESCIYTESAPHTPFICKLSPILAWAGVRKNLESFWTSPTEAILWDSVWRLAWRLTMGLLGSPDTTAPSDEIREQKGNQKKAKKRQDLWILHRSCEGVGSLACVCLLFSVTFSCLF